MSNKKVLAPATEKKFGCGAGSLSAGQVTNPIQHKPRKTPCVCKSSSVVTVQQVHTCVGGCLPTVEDQTNYARPNQEKLSGTNQAKLPDGVTARPAKAGHTKARRAKVRRAKARRTNARRTKARQAECRYLQELKTDQDISRNLTRKMDSAVSTGSPTKNEVIKSIHAGEMIVYGSLLEEVLAALKTAMNPCLCLE